MTLKKGCFAPKFVFFFVTLSLASVTLLYASDTERALYSFNGVRLGTPLSPLIMDASGNLYGASYYETGGNTNGAIFRLTKGTSGQWTMAVLYEFTGAADGRNPQGPLILDAAGNLYGTTPYNGKSPNICCGTVFELTPTANGPWKLTTLYPFKGGSDGAVPGSGLILDAAGNLYGTTQGGGASGYGTVFELSPSGGGWTENVLYAFQGGDDARSPLSGLVLDRSGNLYGETSEGGGNDTLCQLGCGTVFEVSPNSGSWTEKVLYAFTGGSDGAYPTGALLYEPTGNIYGVAGSGGDQSCPSGCGVVFKVSPGSESTWTENVLHAFNGTDGSIPYGQLVLNRAGNLYGIVVQGGSACNCGAIFELSPNSQGGWSESTPYSFAGGSGGAYPDSGLAEDKTGSFYGATAEGGAYNKGTIFKIIP